MLTLLAIATTVLIAFGVDGLPNLTPDRRPILTLLNDGLGR